MWNIDVKYPKRHISKIPKSTPSSPGPLRQMNPKGPLKLNFRIQTANSQTKTNLRNLENKALLKRWPCTRLYYPHPHGSGKIAEERVGKCARQNIQRDAKCLSPNMAGTIRSSQYPCLLAPCPPNSGLNNKSLWMRTDSEKVPSCKLTDESTRLY